MAKSSRPSKQMMWNVGFLLLVIAFGVVSYQFFKSREGLTDMDKVSKIQQGDGLLVVTMPGCGYCEQMKPDLDTLSKESTKVAVVDTGDEEGKKIANELNVQKYPTILQFQGGSASPYEGDRSLDALRKLVSA
jgi:thiol-disulfide isomerase/thioredoxin